MVESIKSLTKNIDVSKNSSSNIDKVDKLNATSVSQKPAVDTVDISGSLPAATLADFTKKVIESKLSSTSFLLSKPEKLKSELKNFEIFLKEHWPSIFASLNESPLNEDEIKILHALLKSIETLNKKVDSKLDFFDDFQKYMKESIEI